MKSHAPVLLVFLLATSALGQNKPANLLDNPSALWDSKVAEKAAWEATKENRQVWAKEKRLGAKAKASTTAGSTEANTKPQAAPVPRKRYNKPQGPTAIDIYAAQWRARVYSTMPPGLYTVPFRR